MNFKTYHYCSCFSYCIISLAAFWTRRKNKGKEKSCNESHHFLSKSGPTRKKPFSLPLFYCPWISPFPCKARPIHPGHISSPRPGMSMTTHSWLQNDLNFLYTENLTSLQGDTRLRPCLLILYNEWTVARS